MKHYFFLFIIFGTLFSCKDEVETTKAEWQPITESVYASGVVKSRNQYQAYATVNGIVDSVFVVEGENVNSGQAIMSIYNKIQQLNRDNALLNANYSDVNANQNRLDEANQMAALALNKAKTDSLLFFRQKKLWEQQVGTRVELEQRELAYQNSKTNYYSALVRAQELKRQIDLNASQSRNSLKISSGMADDYVIKSELNGVVYDILKSKGEIVGLQTPLAVIGSAGEFILEMQVDEYDIFKLDLGQQVLVTMDSYKGESFEGKISKIYPIMNERSKSFLVEAVFVNPPKTLYPNISFEASIIIKKKERALLLPRNFMLNDSTVLVGKGDTVKVKSGLKDFQKMEILSGLTENEEVIKPAK